MLYNQLDDPCFHLKISMHIPKPKTAECDIQQFQGL